MTVGDRLARRSAFALLGRVGGKLMHLLAQVILARQLGAAEFGAFGIGWMVATLGGAIAGLGYDTASIHVATRYLKQSKPAAWAVIAVAIRRTFLTGTVASAAMLVAALVAIRMDLAEASTAYVVAGMVVATPFVASLRVSAAASTAGNSLRTSVLSEDLLRPALLVAVFLALRFVIPPVSAAIVATIASFALSWALVSVVVWRRYCPSLSAAPPDAEAIKAEIKAFAKPASLAGALAVLSYQVDRLVVGALVPPDQFGRYLAAIQLATIFAVVVGAMNLVLRPSAASAFHAGSTAELSSLYQTLTRWILLLIVPAFVVILCAGPELVFVVYGPGFTGAAALLAILSVGLLVNAATGGVGQILLTVGKRRALMAINAVGLAIAFVTAVTLVPKFGPTGGAVAAMASMITINLAQVGVLWMTHRFGPWDQRWLCMAPAAVFALLLTWALAQILRDRGFSAWVVVLASLLVSTAGWLGLQAVLGELREETAVLLRLLRR